MSRRKDLRLLILVLTDVKSDRDAVTISTSINILRHLVLLNRGVMESKIRHSGHASCSCLCCGLLLTVILMLQ